MKSIPIILMEIQIYTIKGFTTPGTKRVHTESGSDFRWEIAVLHISNAWPCDSRDTIYPIHYQSLSLPVRLVEKPERYMTVTATDMECAPHSNKPSAIY